MDKMLDRIFELIGNRHGAQKELADFLEIKSSVITDWKSRRNKSYKKYAERIAAYYGVSLDWLSGATDEKEQKNSPTLEEDEADLARKRLYEKLDSWEIEKLEKLVAFLDLLGET